MPYTETQLENLEYCMGQPMVIEKASDIPPLGRFAIRDMGMTVAAGVVKDIEPR